MAEFPACAQNMVGNNTGACSLQLTGAAITVKFSSTSSSDSWPYNCIRQFRADEDTKQFSFFSGRRGPYGVAEYKFDISEKVLVALQDALTQFTGAQFGQNQNAPTTNGSSTVGGGAGQDLSRTRNDPLPGLPSTPTSETQPGYSSHRLSNIQHKHPSMDNFATLPPPRLRQESLSYRPPVPIPYNSQTIDSRVRRGNPSNNKQYTYHDVVGNFAPPPPPGRAVPGPSLGRKMSHGEDVFGGLKNMSPARTGKLMRQGTAPIQRFRSALEETESPTHGGVFSPPVAADLPESGSSDLDFGMLRRSSPQIDRKNTTRRGRITPPDDSPHHDVYSVPRSNPQTAALTTQHSNSPSPPTPSTPSAPLASDLYQVPRSNSVDVLSQESAEIPTSFPNSPTPDDNVYSVPKPTPGGELYNTPRAIQRDLSREELPQNSSSSIIYNVPSSRPAQSQQKPRQQQLKMVQPPQYEQDVYNTPRPQVTAAEELYNSPRPQTTPPEELYNSPRPQAPAPEELYNSPRPQASGPEELYNSPRPQAPAPEELYNSPRPVGAVSTYHTPSNTIPTQPGGQEVYNVPRSVIEGGQQVEEIDDGLYKVPKSLEQQQAEQQELYNVPKTPTTRTNYDTLREVQNSPGYQANRGGSNLSLSPPHDMQQETYSVPRSAQRFSPRSERQADANGKRYPYDYVDHRFPRTPEGEQRLKPSRSLESLVKNRVNVNPDSSTMVSNSSGRGHHQRTPPPRAHREHKYIEIDIDNFRETSPSSPSSHGSKQSTPMHQVYPQTHPENVYAEISDSEILEQRGSHTQTGYTKVVKHDIIAPNGGPPQYTSSTNNTPLPTQHGRSYSQKNNGISKEARALHEEGYELVLPAEEAARNHTLKQQRMAKTMPTPMGRAQSVSSLSRRTLYNYQQHPANEDHPVNQGSNVTSNLGTSVPRQAFDNDEYVIVNRRELNLPTTQPRDIPVPLPQSGSTSQSLNTGSSLITEDQYEVMSSVKRGSVDGGHPHFTIGHSMKKRGSTTSSNGAPNSQFRTPLQSIRDSLDLESIETSSRGSIGSGSNFDEPVGPLSPLDGPGTAPPIPQPYNGSIPIKRNVVRIASGSPHDVTNSKELKFRSNSVENILDIDERKKKYENVTGRDDITGKSILSGFQPSVATAAVQKKPPMPLPRPGRHE